MDAQFRTIAQLGSFPSLSIDSVQCADTGLSIQATGIQSAIRCHGSGHKVVSLQHIATNLNIFRQSSGIELREPDGAFLVPNNSVHIDRNVNDLDIAHSGLGIVQNGGGDDLNLAFCNSSYNTVGIHGSNGLIAGSPGVRTVGSIDRVNNGLQLCLIVLLHDQRRLGNGHALNLIHHIADLLRDFVSSAVHGVVIHLQQEAGAVDFRQIQSILAGYTGLSIGLGAFPHIDMLAELIQQHDGSDVLVVSHLDIQGRLINADILRIQHGSSVIHGHGHGEGSAIAQSSPVHIALGIHIILGDQADAHIQQSALGQTIHAQASI